MKTPADRLREFIDDPAHPERSRTWLGRLLGISQAAVSQWLVKGHPSRPDDRHRPAIEQITGIPADDWDTPQQRAERRRRDAAIRSATGTG